jgi:hypothetical protein
VAKKSELSARERTNLDPNPVTGNSAKNSEICRVRAVRKGRIYVSLRTVEETLDQNDGRSDEYRVKKHAIPSNTDSLLTGNRIREMHESITGEFP